MDINIKNGFRRLNSKRMYITCPVHWKQLFCTTPENINQLGRRITRTFDFSSGVIPDWKLVTINDIDISQVNSCPIVELLSSESNNNADDITDEEEKMDFDNPPIVYDDIVIETHPIRASEEQDEYFRDAYFSSVQLASVGGATPYEPPKKKTKTLKSKKVFN